MGVGREWYRICWSHQPNGVGLPAVGTLALLGLGACCACQAGPPDDSGGASGGPRVGQVRQAISAPASATTTLRHVGDEYRVEVSCPKGFPGRALNPELHAGATVFRHYRAVAGAGKYAVYYPMSEAEFDALADGAPLSVMYGDEPWQDLGTLNKSNVIEEAP